LRIPPEQIRLGVGGQRGQPKQVSSFDPRQRPIRILGHTAILSWRVPIHPMLQPSVTAMSGRFTALVRKILPLSICCHEGWIERAEFSFNTA